MMNDQKTSTGHCIPKCFSWSAVFVGAFIGIGLSFLLNLFSIGIGLTAFTTTEGSITAFAIGGFLGFLIGGIAAMFFAGFVAGYLGRPFAANCNTGCLYGFVAWCLTLILGVMLSASASHFVTMSSSYLTNHSVAVIKFSSDTVTTTTTTVDAEKAAADTAKAAFALFSLFFIGALASTFGGHFGTICKQKCCPDKPECH